MKKLLFVLLSVCLLACEKSDPNEKLLVGEALGTSFHIKYYSEKEISVEEGLDSIFAMVNNSMSTYQEDSDISRINRGDTSVRVDTLFQEVFELSKKVHEESGGYFDPTVGDLVNMYGFGPEKALKEIDSSTVDSLMQFVGLDKVEITEEGKLLKESPEIYLDFNAIAKGYTVDLIGSFLDKHAVENYLIELGGELLAKGKNLEKNSFWTVGIDDPNQTEGQRALKAAIKLKNRAMATSGNYRKFRIDPETGIKFVHTVDPLTGFTKKSNLLSASVLAETCALADAYATSFMAMGLEQSRDLLERLKNVDAYFVFIAENGEVSEFVTEGFQEVLVEI